MNYNNYQTPYSSYGYQQNYGATPYQNQQQGINQYNAYNQQFQQQSQVQRLKCDFIAVSNLDEVKAHLMQPNTIVLFKDVNSKIIYEKKSDSQGISEIKAYQETNINGNEYVKQQDFISFKNELENRLNNLASNNQKTITNEISHENKGI